MLSSLVHPYPIPYSGKSIASKLRKERLVVIINVRNNQNINAFFVKIIF